MNSTLLTYLLESGLSLLAFYALYHFLLRHETCFAYNRFYLLAATVLALILPWLELPALPAVAPLQAMVPDLTPVFVRAATQNTTAEPTSFFTLERVLLVLYGIGASFFAFRFIKQISTVSSLYFRHRQHAERREGVILIPTQGAIPTFSFFRLVFWDDHQALSKEDQDRVLRHEQAHVYQGHSYDLIWLEILQILFWFNPLWGLYRKALIATHEFLADKAVLETESRTDYGLLLAKQVLHTHHFSLGHYFNKSLTLKRLKMIHQPNFRTSRFKQFLALPLLGLLVGTLSSNQLVNGDTKLPAHPVTTTAASEQSVNVAGPQFPGGEKEMYRFIANSLRIPADAQKNNEYGGVFVQVIIDKKGQPGTFKVLHAAHPSLELEVLRVLKKMPKWETGAGTPSATTYVFPVSILIDGYKNDLTLLNQQFEQMLTKVSSQVNSNKVTITRPIVVTGYGPVE